MIGLSPPRPRKRLPNKCTHTDPTADTSPDGDSGRGNSYADARANDNFSANARSRADIHA